MEESEWSRSSGRKKAWERKRLWMRKQKEKKHRIHTHNHIHRYRYTKQKGNNNNNNKGHVLCIQKIPFVSITYAIAIVVLVTWWRMRCPFAEFHDILYTFIINASTHSLYSIYLNVYTYCCDMYMAIWKCMIHTTDTSFVMNLQIPPETKIALSYNQTRTKKETEKEKKDTHTHTYT